MVAQELYLFFCALEHSLSVLLLLTGNVNSIDPTRLSSMKVAQVSFLRIIETVVFLVFMKLLLGERLVYNQEYV